MSHRTIPDTHQDAKSQLQLRSASLVFGIGIESGDFCPNLRLRSNPWVRFFFGRPEGDSKDFIDGLTLTKETIEVSECLMNWWDRGLI